MRFLLAPDKFKGTLDAPEAAAAMAEGIARALPAAEVCVRLLADGGEGTLECISPSLHSTFERVAVEDAFGNPTEARVLITGVGVMLEMSDTARPLARPTPESALAASSRGTGLAIAEAGRLRDSRLTVWVGGSASTDGGAGAAQAVGWQLLDAAGRDIPPGGGSLRRLARIGPAEGLRATAPELVGACDVANPLLGVRGAAGTFGPQKGAGPSEVAVLEEGLAILADRIGADLGVDVSRVPHGGAGGGMGAGLIAFFGARLVSGFEQVAATVDLDQDVEWADVVVTGEGRVDLGSLDGKVVSNVARFCAERKKICVVVAGEVDLPLDYLPPERALGARLVRSLVATEGREPAFNHTREALARATSAAVREAFA